MLGLRLLNKLLKTCHFTIFLSISEANYQKSLFSLLALRLVSKLQHNPGAILGILTRWFFKAERKFSSGCWRELTGKLIDDL